MLDAIARPFGWLILHLYEWVGNYGLAVILFALLVKIILLPFQLRSKKSMMRMSRMTPRLKELEKKFGNDQQRYQMEMNKLYKEEGVRPMGGCIWSLIPFPILLALYRAIRYPLTTMMRVPSELMEEGGAIYEKMMDMGFNLADFSTRNSAAAYSQIFQSQFITNNFSAFADMSDKLQPLSYKFLGMDLAQVPMLRFWQWDWSSFAGSDMSWGPMLGLFLIPVISALLSWLSMKVSNSTSVQTQQSQSAGMMLMMPLISLWICFSMPAVLGVYWIAQYVFGILQDLVLNRVFTRQLDIEDADRIAREKARAAELEAKREETERLKAAGATVVNKNTSKKKQQAAAAQHEAERKAAAAKAAKAAKKGGSGGPPDSQVDNRRYARGRAYVPDRYSNPEEAEEKTAAASAESTQFDEENGLLAEIPEGQETVGGEETPALEEHVEPEEDIDNADESDEDDEESVEP